MNDLRGKAVLITGGTMGIGLATGLAFARQGAVCTLTHKWGTADEDAIRSQFRHEDLPLPHIVQADVAQGEDTDRLLAEMRHRHESIEVFVSNVSFGLIVKSLDDYSLRSLFRSIEYSAWPLVEYPRRIKAVFGSMPRYIVGLSSDGPDHYCRNYDFVAATKALLETLCRYMSYRFFDEDVRLNVVRSRFVRTESLRATLGQDFEAFAARFSDPGFFIDSDEVARAIVALCSGLMDGVRGQVLMVDRGTTFSDNLMRIYNERQDLSL
jgi:NAD(P)-dependent dehydrogenase (short-subunit alcohol dehydrogenase family)